MNNYTYHAALSYTQRLSDERNQFNPKLLVLDDINTFEELCVRLRNATRIFSKIVKMAGQLTH